MNDVPRYASLAIALISSCVVDVVDTGIGKPCPCDEGSTCRVTTDRCEPALGSCDPKVEVSAFGPEWWTPETIRWKWNAVGDAADFGSYELFLGPTAESVAPGSIDARVFDAAVNPELSFFVPPHPTLGTPAAATTTDGLEPLDVAADGAGRYFARLEVRDRNGCPYTSEVVSRETEVARDCPFVVFGDALAGSVSPPTAKVVSNCGKDEGPCLVCSRADGCLSPAGFDLSLGYLQSLEELSLSDFESGRGILELSVAVLSQDPIFYAEVGLSTQDAQGNCSPTPTWKFSELFLRAAEEPGWQKLQIPLNALRDANGNVPAHADVIDKTWCALHFRAEPGAATEIRFDRVAGCW